MNTTNYLTEEEIEKIKEHCHKTNSMLIIYNKIVDKLKETLKEYDGKNILLKSNNQRLKREFVNKVESIFSEFDKTKYKFDIYTEYTSLCLQIIDFENNNHEKIRLGNFHFQTNLFSFSPDILELHSFNSDNIINSIEKIKEARDEFNRVYDEFIKVDGVFYFLSRDCRRIPDSSIINPHV